MSLVLPPFAPSLRPVILADGCFDPFHAGHVDYLKAARLLDEQATLVVNVAPDAAIRAKGRPVLQSQADRCATVGAVNVVDQIVAWPTLFALDQIRPAIYVKGVDWQGRLPADQVAVCRAYGIAIRYTETHRYQSSTLSERLRYGASVGEFAALVLSQQSATTPWVPVTPYDLETRRKVEGRHPWLILETFQPSAVLDVGCEQGSLLLLMAEARQTTDRPWVGVGVDLHPPVGGVGPAQLTFCQGSVLDDHLEERLPGRGRYDLVICREVLEHLPVRELARAVSMLCRLSTRFVYVTTRFHPCPAGLLDVATSDGLDPTHISLLNPDFLRVLFTLQGYQRRADLETRLDWQQKGRVLVYERPTIGGVPTTDL